MDIGATHYNVSAAMSAVKGGQPDRHREQERQCLRSTDQLVVRAVTNSNGGRTVRVRDLGRLRER